MEHQPVFAVWTVRDLDPEIPLIAMDAEHVNHPAVLAVTDPTLFELRGDDIGAAWSRSAEV